MTTVLIIAAIVIVGTVFLFIRSRRQEPVLSPFPRPEPIPAPEPETSTEVGRPLDLKVSYNQAKASNQLNWNGNVSGGVQDGVFVYRSIGKSVKGEVWLNTTPLPPGTEEFIDNQIDPSVRSYTYRVRNSYKGAWSEYSDPMTITLLWVS
jgi:hypothetical protein